MSWRCLRDRAPFFRHWPLEDKTLDWWPELYHEIFHEPESEAVMARFAEWLEAHL